jgi:uncharacterized protein (DUF1501 family)
MPTPRLTRHACAEHDRSALLRRGVALAGRGLPAIEPGMPVPAGTGLDRRSFLARSAGLLLTVYGAGRLPLPALDEGIARAATAATPPERVLVSVFLDGGADSLSMLHPSGDDRYRRLRPRLALPAEAGQPFAEDDRLRWHPALEGLARLHRQGKVAVMPAVGYTRPDQSHFTSRHYWEVGALDPGVRTGWLGRWLDTIGAPDNPLQGLSLDGHLAPSLATASVPVAAIDGPGRYDLWTSGVWGGVEDEMHAALALLGQAVQGGDPGLAAAGDVALQSKRLYDRLRPFAPADDDKPAFRSPVAYPKVDDEFPERMAGLAAMLAAGLPIRCVAITAPGAYDTHSDQPKELERGLRITFDTLAAFQADLEARGLADRVLVHVWSEFGRRARENGSNGTDHGAAGAGFLVGSRVRGKLIGEFPGLAGGLDGDGNLRATADFRAVYAAILEQWLGADAAAILPEAGRFERPAIVP